MPDPKNKRTYDQETLIIPGLRLEPAEPSVAHVPAAENHRARNHDQSLQDREKLVNKLIDHLKGL
jgi:hypothetical protein